MRRRRNRLNAIGALVILAVAAAACGSDDEEGSTTSGGGETSAAAATTAGGSATTTSGSATTAESASTGAPSFTGDPIKIITIWPTGTTEANFPEGVAGVRAGVRALNARGGINGHEVQVDY